MYSRRDFLKITAAGIPLTAFAAGIDSVVNGVRLGAITYSFRQMPRTAGASDAVLACGVSLLTLPPATPF